MGKASRERVMEHQGDISRERDDGGRFEERIRESRMNGYKCAGDVSFHLRIQI